MMPHLDFSTKALKHQKPPKPKPGKIAQVDYWDRSTPGFGLRLSSTGARTWTVLTRVLRDGQVKQIRVALGRYAERDGEPGLTLAAARGKAEELRQIVETGGDPSRIKEDAKHSQRAASENTFKLVAERFLTEHHPKNKKSLRPATLKQYTGVLLGDDCEPLHPRPISEITRRDIIDTLNRIQKRGVTVTANRTLAALRVLMHWSIQQDLIETTPTDNVKPPAAETSRDRHLFGSREEKRSNELALVWRAFDAVGSLGAFAKVLLLTGQRRSEVANMRVDELLDFHTPEARWLIPAERSKTGVKHFVPLCQMAVQAILSMPRLKDCPYVFSTDGKRPIAGFSKLKAKIDTRIAEIIANESERYAGQMTEPWVFHDLRRTVETGLAELGIAREIRDALLNHAGDKIQTVYNQSEHTEAKRQALLQWERHLTEAVSADAKGAEYVKA